jgi:hypothetical protein
MLRIEVELFGGSEAYINLDHVGGLFSYAGPDGQRYLALVDGYEVHISKESYDELLNILLARHYSGT